MYSQIIYLPHGRISFPSLILQSWRKNVLQWSSSLTIARTQMLLISLAHTTSSRLETISSSTVYNDGLSNRLAASVGRVRFLGMIVGEAVSCKNDPEERRLRFKVPETEDPS